MDLANDNDPTTTASFPRSVRTRWCVVGELNSTFSASRTNFAPWWLQWWIFPHNVNYHAEYHLYPSIPFYNLPECHCETKKRGLLEGTEVRTLAQTYAVLATDPPLIPSESSKHNSRITNWRSFGGG